MANQVMNIARGAVRHLMTDTYAGSSVAGGLNPANSRMIVVVLEANEADDTLNNYDELATLLGAAGNTEWTATNPAAAS